MTSSAWPLVACLAVAVLAGFLEAVGLARARRALVIRIHVNGTRGKTAVTRLIWAALTEAGIPALGKTTGNRPSLLLPGGGEQPIVRRGRATIGEQIRVLRIARRTGARAIVIECMALRPELQWASEHRIIRSTIGVVTNARLDHGEVMGATTQEVARSLSNTIPRDGLVVLGDDRHLEIFEERAASMGSRVLVAEPSPPGATEPSLFAEVDNLNAGIALAVTRSLGIDDAVARAGMARAPRDQGAASVGEITLGARTVPYLNLSAANDPESTGQLLHRWLASSETGGREGDQPPVLVVFNHRNDRPHRLRGFLATDFGVPGRCRLVLTGDRPALRLWLASRRVGAMWARPGTVREVIERCAAETRAIVLCGNSKGLNRDGF